MSATITDPILGILFLALLFYALFWVVRAGVAAGIRKAVDPRYLTQQPSDRAPDPLD